MIFCFVFFFSVEGENRTYQKKMKGYIYILEAASDTIAPIEKIIFVFLNDVIWHNVSIEWQDAK